MEIFDDPMTIPYLPTNITCESSTLWTHCIQTCNHYHQCRTWKYDRVHDSICCSDYHFLHLNVIDNIALHYQQNWSLTYGTVLGMDIKIKTS